MTDPQFDTMSLIREAAYPVQKYGAFVNFFQQQAQRFSDRTYIQYEKESFEDKEPVVETLTYDQVDRITSNLAIELDNSLQCMETIAILEDHSAGYLVLLIALFKLRKPVMILSTRNSSAALTSLLLQANVDTMFYGKNHHQILDDVTRELLLESEKEVKFISVPTMDLDLLAQAPLNADHDNILDRKFSNDDLEKTVLIMHRYSVM